MVELSDVDTRKLSRFLEKLRELLQQKFLVVLVRFELTLERCQEVFLLLLDALELLIYSQCYHKIFSFAVLYHLKFFLVGLLDRLLFIYIGRFLVSLRVIQKPMSQERHRFLRLLLVKLRKSLGNDPTNLVVL